MTRAQFLPICQEAWRRAGEKVRVDGALRWGKGNHAGDPERAKAEEDGPTPGPGEGAADAGHPRTPSRFAGAPNNGGLNDT